MSEEPRSTGEGDAEERAPRVPRGRGLYISGAQLVRVGMLGALLVAIAVLGRPCADGVSRFIVSFGPPVGTTGEDAPLGPGEVRRLTDEEIRERFPSLVGRDAEAEGETDAEADPEGEAETDAEAEAETDAEAEGRAGAK